jgi:hypothetical protein
MEENRFFKWIWRVNNIAVFIGLMGFFYLFYVNEIRRNHHVEPREVITSVAKDPKGLEKWVLQATHERYASDYTLLSLVSENNKVKVMNHISSYSKSAYYSDTAKNILFINTKDNSSSWLFKGNNQLILNYSSLMESDRISSFGSQKRESKPQIIYYKIIDKDTNDDKIITEEDKPNFAISKMSGANYKVIVSGMEKQIALNMIDKDTLHLVYQKEAKGYSLKLDINSFKILSNELLPKVSES